MPARSEKPSRRIAELLHDEGLADLLADGEVTVYIVFGVGTASRQILDERVLFAHPQL